VVNLGARLAFAPVAVPLLAPPAATRWRPAWSSEDVRYGGVGTPTVDADDGGWWLPAESTILLAPVPASAAPPAPRPKRFEREKR
jgi:maltooligosyltrehalose trehalohydrolase